MKINFKKTYDFDDVLIVPKPSELNSRSEIKLEVSYVGKHSKTVISGFPMIAANMTCVGTIEMAKALSKRKFFTALHKFLKEEDLIKFYSTLESQYSFYTLGTSEEETTKFKNVYRSSPNLNKINIDAANGYMYSFLDKIKFLRDYCQSAIIMAGNVCTPDGVENIIKAGADIVKVGIGSGASCLTRSKAGIGRKQFTVALECGQAANELHALCCSDGGCRTPADVCKAFAAGSHFVMAGNLFAGYDQCESEWEYDEEKNKTKMFMYGMSSKYANDKYCGGLKTYRTSEGKEHWVDYKGDVDNLLRDIAGGVASCCTYTNTKHLENLYKNCQFTI